MSFGSRLSSLLSVLLLPGEAGLTFEGRRGIERGMECGIELWLEWDEAIDLDVSWSLSGLLTLIGNDAFAWVPSMYLLLIGLLSLVHCLQIPLHFNPLSVSYCSSPDDIFQPQTISITPDPPVRGKDLLIFINGTLAQRVESGTAHVKVKLGFIQLLNRDFDLCDEVTQVGKKCPLEKGPITVTHTVGIPEAIPPVN